MKTYAKFSLTALILSVAMIVVAASIARTVRAAGPWYVAPGGSDGNTCLSAVSPCATINGAIGKVSPGDTVLVATGTYTGTGTEVVSLRISATLSGGWDASFTMQSGMSTIDAQNARRGITVNGTVSAIIERFVAQNGSGCCFNGAGIRVDGTLILNNSSVTSNAGEGIYVNGINGASGNLSLNNSTVNMNSGGGIVAEMDAYLTVNHSTISSNSPGGIVNYSHRLVSINESTVSDNAYGSGINNGYGHDMIIKSTTISGNSGDRGGGIFNQTGGVITLTNSTLSGNNATYGGGIYNYQGTVSIYNSTIVNNIASQDGYIYGGGGIEIDSGTVNMQNSILAGNSNTNGADCYGTIHSFGYNLLGNTSHCTLSGGSGDATNVNAVIGPLQNNGGPTLTHALFLGSPAIDAGNPAGCTDNLGNPLTTDQRGNPRVRRCDIGAYELQPLEYSTKTVNVSKGIPGQPLTYTIALTNGGASTITNIFVTDTLPINLTYQSNSLFATGGTYGFNSGVITWTGSLNAGELVTVTFGATVNQTAPLSSTITNSAVINGGGEILARSAIVDIPLAKIYFPLVARNYCPGPFYSDDFSNPASSWPVGNSANVQYGYLNGEYRILLKNTNWSILVSPGLKTSDSIVSVDVRNATGVYGSYGLLFGLSDDFSQFYDLEIDPLGNYAIYRYDSVSFTPLAQGSSGSIQTGTATNRIKLERNGALIKAYANGQLLTSISDGTYTGLRRVGLIAFSYNQHNVDVRFDNFKAYDVTCESIATSLSPAGQMTDKAAVALDGLSGSGTMTPGPHPHLDILPAGMSPHLSEDRSHHQ